MKSWFSVSAMAPAAVSPRFHSTYLYFSWSFEEWNKQLETEMANTLNSFQNQDWNFVIQDKYIAESGVLTMLQDIFDDSAAELATRAEKGTLNPELVPELAERYGFLSNALQWQHQIAHRSVVSTTTTVQNYKR